MPFVPPPMLIMLLISVMEESEMPRADQKLLMMVLGFNW